MPASQEFDIVTTKAEESWYATASPVTLTGTLASMLVLNNIGGVDRDLARIRLVTSGSGTLTKISIKTKLTPTGNWRTYLEDNDLATVKRLVWQNPDLSPQEVFDLYGKNAALLCAASDGAKNLLLLAGDDVGPIVPRGSTLAINADGTVTVGKEQA